MLRSKRNLAIICAVLLVVAVTVGGTLAYFHDSGEVINKFTTAGNGKGDEGTDIEIDEPGYNPEEAEDMIPGDTIVKDPTVTNLRGDAYVRFIVKLVDKDTQKIITDKTRADKILSTLFYDESDKIVAGQKYTHSALIDAGAKTPVNPKFVLDNSRGSVGEYYYNYDGIMTHDQTAKLFTNVVISTDWDQADIDILGNYDIVVIGQAIQAENMADADEAFDALDDEVTTSAP